MIKWINAFLYHTALTLRFGPFPEIGFTNNVGYLFIRLLKLLGRLDDEISHSTTLLMHAAYNNDIKRINWLLDAGATLDYQDKDYSNTALMWACRSDSPQAVQLLIEKGAKLELEGLYKETALCCAVYYRRYEALKYLIDAGANVNHKDDLSYLIYGEMTPLQRAYKLLENAKELGGPAEIADSQKFINLLEKHGAKND